MRRLRGAPLPWTTDPIISRYRFTNAYRAADRASQFLIALQYAGSQSEEDLFFRTTLFRIFNKIETWQALESACDGLSWPSYRFERYGEVLTHIQRCGKPIYSAAYVIPPVRMNEVRKHENHLRLIELLMKEQVAHRLTDCRSAQDAYRLLRSFPGLGSFLAYQLLIDLNYSSLLNFSEMDFVVAGPGARDGIRKCFRAIGVTDPDIVRYMADTQDEHFARLGLKFDDLWGRPLQLIDCQNLFCETDKYARVAHPELRGQLGRTRIKRTYHAGGPTQRPWFPPKWGLNTLVDEDLARRSLR